MSEEDHHRRHWEQCTGMGRDMKPPGLLRELPGARIAEHRGARSEPKTLVNRGLECWAFGDPRFAWTSLEHGDYREERPGDPKMRTARPPHKG